MRLTIDVPRQIVSGPSQGHQDLFQASPFAGVHPHMSGIQPVPHEGLDLLAVQHLVQDRRFLRAQDQPVGGVHLQLQAAVP